MEKDVKWCLQPHCHPENCSEAITCPMRKKERKYFRLSLLGLWLLMALCGLAQHYHRVQSTHRVTVPDRKELFFSWERSPDGALIYAPENPAKTFVVLKEATDSENQG